jgi:polyisoprenoid-binding protein YceI
MQEHSMRRLTCFLSVLSLVLLHASSAPADVQRFHLNLDASQISATIDDPFGNRVNGTLRLNRGEARGDPDRLAETASVSLVLDAASYKSNLGLRDHDVQENYLEVKHYPVIRFESTSVVRTEQPRSGSDPWLIILNGVLELHGVKREILVSIRLFYQTNKIVAQGQFALLLEDYNIAVPTLLFLKTGNKVQVDFLIAGERQP